MREIYILVHCQFSSGYPSYFQDSKSQPLRSANIMPDKLANSGEQPGIFDDTYCPTSTQDLNGQNL